MKYYSIIILLIFSFSCQTEKDETTLELSSFSQSGEYDDFSEYRMQLVDETAEPKYEYSISFVGESSQTEYFRFEETLRFNPYYIDSLHHWIPVKSQSTLFIDSSLFDFNIKSFSGFSKWTSRDYSLRTENPDPVNELFVQSTIQLTNSKFVQQPESSEEATSYIQLESPGDIFSLSINYAYTSDEYATDTLSLTPTLSGEDEFMEFLRQNYAVDEKIILKPADELK